MRILGDEASTQFRTLAQEPGVVYGRHDVLVGREERIRTISISGLWGITDEMVTRRPTLYLHISNSPWTQFVAYLKEYCLPWVWKAVYLDPENGSPLERVLVYTGGELTDRLKAVAGLPLFIARLIDTDRYVEVLDQEFLRIPREDGLHENRVSHVLGECVGVHVELGPYQLCPIYRARDLFSLLTYYFLKLFSSEWEEVMIEVITSVGDIRERILVRASDHDFIARSEVFSWQARIQCWRNH